ncbi:hypothetical protein Tco_0959103, partial [Tanacetum coccineum]
MLGAARVQIPEKNLDDLHSSREEDETSETMDPQDSYYSEGPTSSANITLLSLFFGVTATNLSLGLLMLGQ